jgi:hypothetical protein
MPLVGSVIHEHAGDLVSLLSEEYDLQPGSSNSSGSSGFIPDDDLSDSSDVDDNELSWRIDPDLSLSDWKWTENWAY